MTRVPAFAALRRARVASEPAGLFTGEAAAELADRIRRHPENRPTPRQTRLADIGVPDALTALHDALDDGVVWPDVRLAVLALDAELITNAQRQLLAATLYELADAFRRATA